MSRLKIVFDALSARGGKALIPYIMAGDPHPQHTVAQMHALVGAGANVIELGVPFSDPMADGPVIQLAGERALAAGMTLRGVLALVSEFRRTDALTPIVLMGYLNPIERFGLAAFTQAALAAGVDGLLVVDLAVEESKEFSETLRGAGLDLIFLLAPTSSAERIRAIAARASGYLYYVSLKGVTGAANLDVASVTAKLAEIRGITDLPVAVGFGIRDADSAARVAAVADAVVVGSALVSEVERNRADPTSLPGRLAAKLAPMRAAMDGRSVG
ncbi:MAG: tryptophan synthase subunit alpha [Panacagrimonas sp.]